MPEGLAKEVLGELLYRGVLMRLAQPEPEVFDVHGLVAREALRLLDDEAARAAMKDGLAQVRLKLAGGSAAPARAALAIKDILEGQVTHVC